ncbi:MAG: hypothetical protein ACOYOA_06490 [Saprospiraceae bacterium]
MRLPSLLFLRTYSKIRLLQLYRLFATAGWGYLLILAFIAMLVLLSIMESMQKNQQVYWAFFPVLMAGTLHFKRKDRDWMSQLETNRFYLYFIDNWLIASPFFVLILIFQSLTTSTLSFLLISVIALFPVYKKSDFLSFFSYTFIPLYLFEWRTGLRKSGLSIPILFLLSIIGSAFEGTIIIYTLLSSLMISTFYNHCEPKEWLDFPFKTGKKITQHVFCWTIVMSPQLLLHIILHRELWYFSLISWYFGAMLITFCIVFKYSLWSPFRTEVGIDRAASIFVGMMLIIFTSPACLFAIIYYQMKATKNPQLKENADY